jgi:hypothetical protein
MLAEYENLYDVFDVWVSMEMMDLEDLTSTGTTDSRKLTKASA